MKKIIKLFFVFLYLANNHSALAQDDSLNVMVAGDFMIGSWGLEEIAKNGVDYPVLNLQSLFGANSVNMCNLEAPFTQATTKYPNKTYTFKVPPRLAEILNKLPIHYVSLANNHMMDYGVQGLKDTIHTLQRQKIAYSGAGLNFAEAIKPAIISVQGLKIGIISAGAIFPKAFWANQSTAGIFFPWEDKLIKTLKSTRPLVDYLFVAFHWGAEKRNTAKKYQIKLGHLSINHGADMVWGHHPHVVQGIEIYQDKPIIYSLGNFIFASFSKTATGMIVKTTFKGGQLSDMQIIPLNINNFENPIQPSVYTGKDKLKLIEKINNLSELYKVRFNSNGKLINKRN